MIQLHVHYINTWTSTSKEKCLATESVIDSILVTYTKSDQITQTLYNRYKKGYQITLWYHFTATLKISNKKDNNIDLGILFANADRYYSCICMGSHVNVL